jgi:hypothetical protein
MFVALTGRDPKSYQMKNLAAPKKLMFEEGSSIKFTDKKFLGTKWIFCLRWNSPKRLKNFLRYYFVRKDEKHREF